MARSVNGARDPAPRGMDVTSAARGGGSEKRISRSRGSICARALIVLTSCVAAECLTQTFSERNFSGESERRQCGRTYVRREKDKK